MPGPRKPSGMSGTVSSAKAKGPMRDKYGRALTEAEATKRRQYRASIKGKSGQVAEALRKKEMERRAEFRRTTTLKGAKGPGKAQAMLEARRMASQKRGSGASVSESRRMSGAMASKTAARTKAGVQRARMTNRARRAGM
jgi:hypothetical protein